MTPKLRQWMGRMINLPNQEPDSHLGILLSVLWQLWAPVRSWSKEGGRNGSNMFKLYQIIGCHRFVFDATTSVLSRVISEHSQHCERCTCDFCEILSFTEPLRDAPKTLWLQGQISSYPSAVVAECTRWKIAMTSAKLKRDVPTKNVLKQFKQC